MCSPVLVYGPTSQTALSSKAPRHMISVDGGGLWLIAGVRIKSVGGEVMVKVHRTQWPHEALKFCTSHAAHAFVAAINHHEGGDYRVIRELVR